MPPSKVWGECLRRKLVVPIAFLGKILKAMMNMDLEHTWGPSHPPKVLVSYLKQNQTTTIHSKKDKQVLLTSVALDLLSRWNR